MEMSYWLAEHTSGQAHRALRFTTREEFDEYIKEAGLRVYVQKFYDLPRKITVEVKDVLEVINGCLHRESYEPLPWEKK